MADSLREVNLVTIEGTSETFKDYGQVIGTSEDSDRFGPNDAQLHLSKGTPRFYIMQVPGKSTLDFADITHHAEVTQCLGSIGGHVWYLGVAKSTIVESDGSGGTHSYNPPAVEDVRVFKFSGPIFVKLHRGTWHAGPLFLDNYQHFYNLELSDTNVVDHATHYFYKEDGVIFQFEP